MRRLWHWLFGHPWRFEEPDNPMILDVAVGEKISGHVHDSYGYPVAGVTVNRYDRIGLLTPLRESTVTDSNGRWELTRNRGVKGHIEIINGSQGATILLGPEAKS